MKKSLRSIFIIGITSLLFAGQAVAQTDFTLYHMQLVPYRMYQNPALVPQARAFAGIPGLSSIYFHTSNAFSYNDLITKMPDDSLKIDVDKLLSKLGDRNNMFTNIDLDILSFGFKFAKSDYFTLSVRERGIFRLSYPKDFINFAWKGNANIGLGKELNFNPRADAMVFDELALGLAKEFNDHLSLGVHVKLLNGHVNAYTERANVSLYTDPDDFSFRMKSDIIIRTAGIDSMDSNKKNILKGGNFGMGIDIGATYKLNSKFSFSASLLDLGYIKWKKQLLTLQSNRPGEVATFNGVEINDFFGTNKSFGDAFQVVLDSLKNQFKIDSLYNQSYTAYLPMQFYAGADFNINERNTLGILFHGQFYDKKLIPAFSLSYYTQLGRVLGLSASYNVMNRSYNNIGVGMSVNLGPMQLYATTDNILVVPNFKTAQNVHLHAGLVLTFGRPKKDTDQDGVPDKADECPLIPGLAQFKGCPDADGDGIKDADDACPDVKGLAAFKGCPDSDGDSIIDSQDACPLQAGLAIFNGCPDTDSDGVPDKDDLCPKVAGPLENKGCPVVDTDGDGIKDSEDACPNNPGPLENKGCPWQDTDGDGIADIHDKCPTIAGVAENDGCPLIKKEEQEVLNTAFSSLEFESGKSVIKQVSYASLDKLAALLLKKPDWKLQLSGHTDNVGKAESNMTLSKNRTLAVKNYLIKKGMPAERIKPEWYGQTRPVAANTTPEGRQKNRRVEIAIFF